MSEPVRVGIVGLGFMAATHIKAYAKVPEAKIVALCSPSGKRLDGDFTGVAGNVGDKDPVKLDMSQAKTFREYAAMLADPEIDLIDICSPTASHAALSIAALEAGKHVLCEKPLTRTVEEARQVLAASQKAKTFLMPAMCMRFWPGWSLLKEAIVDERYGKVMAASFRRVAEPPGWGQQNFLNGLKSGGALLDLHVHDTDFIQWCFGTPKAVRSTGYSKISGAIDHVFTQYLYEGGPIVTAEGGWAMTAGFGFNMAYTVNFERATLDFDLSRGANPLRVIVDGKPVESPELSSNDGYVGEIQHIIAAVQSGQAPTIVRAEDGLEAMMTCAAEEEAVSTGRTLSC